MKALYIIFVFLYAAAGLTGLMIYAIHNSRYAYISSDIPMDFLHDHLFSLIVLAIMMACIIILWYRQFNWDLIPEDQLTPRQRQQRAVRNSLLFKIVMPFLIALFSFAINMGYIFLYDNQMPEQGKLTVAGIVMNKDTKVTRTKSGQRRSFFLSINDTVHPRNYYFRVSRDVFTHYNQDDVFVKEFHVSHLGSIYRREE